MKGRGSVIKLNMTLPPWEFDNAPRDLFSFDSGRLSEIILLVFFDTQCYATDVPQAAFYVQRRQGVVVATTKVFTSQSHSSKGSSEVGSPSACHECWLIGAISDNPLLRVRK